MAVSREEAVQRNWTEETQKSDELSYATFKIVMRKLLAELEDPHVMVARERDVALPQFNVLLDLSQADFDENKSLPGGYPKTIEGLEKLLVELGHAGVSNMDHFLKPHPAIGESDKDSRPNVMKMAIDKALHGLTKQK